MAVVMVMVMEEDEMVVYLEVVALEEMEVTAETVTMEVVDSVVGMEVV